MENILEQLGITKEELIDRIVTKALGITADYRQTGEESWEDIPLSKVVDNKITNAIGNLIETMKPMIQTRIDEIMTAEMEKVFTLPFQPVDRWGEKKGDPTTIRDMIADQAQKYWNTKVGGNGEEDDSYNKIIRAEYYAKKVMTEVYDHELVKEVGKMAKQLKERIPKTIADEISSTVLSYIK